MHGSRVPRLRGARDAYIKAELRGLDRRRASSQRWATTCLLCVTRGNCLLFPLSTLTVAARFGRDIHNSIPIFSVVERLLRLRSMILPIYPADLVRALFVCTSQLAWGFNPRPNFPGVHVRRMNCFTRLTCCADIRRLLEG